MTFADGQARAVAILSAVGIDQPARDARRLMAWAAGVPLYRLTLMSHDVMPDTVQRLFEDAVDARAGRMPLSHITGGREFFGRNFKVSRHVLDPRPETETLVVAALERPFQRILDLGTGSGAIILSLLAERSAATGLAVDVSPKALDVFSKNAIALDVSGRVTSCVSDWFDAVEGRFDLIVSNPPYITDAEMLDLSPEVRDHEPRLALEGGPDGLEPYRVIARQSGRYLTPNGRVMVEIGPTQARHVTGFFHAAGFSETQVLDDLDGRNRVVCAW